MDIFYARISKIKDLYDKSFLNNYADTELKNEKRFYEYTIGRFITKTTAKIYYELQNTDIVVNEAGKPFFKNSDLHFSISHSKDIVMVCFDEYPCGLDIEYIKVRDLNRLSDFFNRPFTDLDDFYKYWTMYEASYKLSKEALYSVSFKFSSDYYISVVSEKQSNLKFEIKEFNSFISV